MRYTQCVVMLNNVFIQFQSEQISRITTANADLSTNVAALNTEKTRLDIQVKESIMTNKKLTDEKKDICRQLEENNKNNTVLEQKMCNIQKKLDDSEKSLKRNEEEMQVKLKESADYIEGKNLLIILFLSNFTV